MAEEQGGYFRFAEAIKIGIHRSQLQDWASSGTIVKEGRGLYRLSNTDHPYPDFALIAKSSPHAVVCLISALSYHSITTQIPHELDIALPKGIRAPKLDYPPIEVVHVSEPAFSSGVEAHDLEGLIVRIYSVEKTIADCFKFRKKIGLDVALEALKLYRERKKLNVGELMKQARICRVANIMDPYLEALI